MSTETVERAHFTNRFFFILAAVGSAIGLGNIWKFPYIAGVNGGGAFVLVYLACIAVVGIPIFVAELYVGQRAQANAVKAFEVLHKKKTAWRGIGLMGVLSSFLILSFYSVVGGWVLDFEYRSVLNQFAGLSNVAVKDVLGSLFSSPGRQIFWHFVFMAATVGMVLGGIKKGIERWSKILMPALLLLLGFLMIRSFFLPGFGDAFHFLFSPDVSKLTSMGILEAVGHSFFTLSLGMGAMVTYGSYLSKKENLVKIAITVGFMDTAVALMAGFIIFSVVFSYGMEAGSGPTLMFQTLPMLFSQMTGGYFVSTAFFLLVAFAAFTSSISLLEVVVTYTVERYKISRTRATLTTGAAIFSLGILTVLSTNVLSDFKIIGLTFFDLFDKLTSSIFLPLGGLLFAVFYGWVLGPKAVAATVGKGKGLNLFYHIFLWTVRIFAPIAVVVVLVNGLRSW